MIIKYPVYYNLQNHDIHPLFEKTISYTTMYKLLISNYFIKNIIKLTIAGLVRNGISGALAICSLGPRNTMKQVTFYLLEGNQSYGELSTTEALACRLATEYWRTGKWLLIACEDQNQAKRLDNALWEFEPYAFVPHNLIGEGPKLGAPVELLWRGLKSNSSRDILISLDLQFSDFATTFSQIVDFVPDDDDLKKLARDRYRAYRSIGFHLTTTIPATNRITI